MAKVTFFFNLWKKICEATEGLQRKLVYIYQKNNSSVYWIIGIHQEDHIGLL